MWSRATAAGAPCAPHAATRRGAAGRRAPGRSHHAGPATGSGCGSARWPLRRHRSTTPGCPRPGTPRLERRAPRPRSQRARTVRASREGTMSGLRRPATSHQASGFEVSREPNLPELACRHARDAPLHVTASAPSPANVRRSRRDIALAAAATAATATAGPFKAPAVPDRPHDSGLRPQRPPHAAGGPAAAGPGCARWARRAARIIADVLRDGEEPVVLLHGSQAVHAAAGPAAAWSRG